ncbi:MAG: hypothetical protein ACREXK_02190, partial [Gammaproteobacteria bacterium]
GELHRQRSVVAVGKFDPLMDPARERHGEKRARRRRQQGDDLQFYQLSYSHQGKSTTRFVRPGYAAKIRKELAAYKRFRGLTQEWLTLALTLSQLRLEQARRELDE